MPSTSYEKLLEKIQTNIKHELGELDKFVQLHQEFMSTIKVGEGDWFESGNTLNFKIQRTSTRLLEQMDVLVSHVRKNKNLSVSQDLGGSTPSTGKTKPVRRRARKTKASS